LYLVGRDFDILDFDVLGSAVLGFGVRVLLVLNVVNVLVRFHVQIVQTLAPVHQPHFQDWFSPCQLCSQSFS